MVPTHEEQEILDAALQAEQQAQQQAQKQKQQQQQLNIQNAMILAAAIITPGIANAAANPSNTPSPMNVLLIQLNPQLQQNLGQLVNNITSWNNQFASTTLNQLDSAAVGLHPLMQPTAQNQPSMMQGLSNLAQAANLSPALQAGLSQLSQLTSSMNNNLSPSSTVGEATSLASSLMSSVAGLSAAVPAVGAVAGLVNVASMMEKKLAGMLNPAAASQQTPNSPQADQGIGSKLASMLKDSFKPGPGGKGS